MTVAQKRSWVPCHVMIIAILIILKLPVIKIPIMMMMLVFI